MGKLSEVIELLFKLKTKSYRNPVVGALQILQTQFLRVNDDRLAWFIINLGVNDAYVLNGQDVSTTNGILVSANGGDVHMIYSEDFDLVAEAWYGLAPGGAVNILVLEVIGS